MIATVEAVEESGGIQCLPIIGVGDAQCPLLYIYVDSAMRLAVYIGIAQEIAHERGYEFIVGTESPLPLLIEVYGDGFRLVYLGKHLQLMAQLGVDTHICMLDVLVILNL